MIQFIKNRAVWYILSAVFLLVSGIALGVLGLKAGIDFAGGSLMEVRFESEIVDQDSIREILIPIGDEFTSNNEEGGVVSFNNAVIQETDEGWLIRSLEVPEAVHEQILAGFGERFGGFEELRYQTIGPIVGESMKKKAGWAVGMAIVAIIIFIAYAFRKVPANVSPWKFGLAAVAALIHDVVIVIGVFAVFGYLWGVEIDLLFITALLTIMGFSVHDTIVVFDRLRENLLRTKGTENFEVTANRALNETLARSINTSLTTLVTLGFLLVLGGESIRWFVAAMMVGILAGTYSSIFFATPLLVSWSGKK